MDYEDFLLRISPRESSECSIAVKSPAGEGTGIFRLSFAADQNPFLTNGSWLALRARGAQGACASGEPRHLQVEDDEKTSVVFSPEQVGSTLFRALFTGEVANLFHESLGRTALARGRGLRIKLCLDLRIPELAQLQGLPWELLYRSETDDFLGLVRATPIIRCLDVQRPMDTAPRPVPLRILLVVSQPSNLPPLQLDRERRNLERIWRRRGRVEVEAVERADLGSLREKLLHGTYHVLHFMGHGGFEPETGEGAVYFEAEDGTARAVSGRALATELKDFRELRLVFLNACETAILDPGADRNPFTGVATALVLAGIPAVMAMQAPVPDGAAVTFSKVFYQRLAAGDPLDTATVEGRLAVKRLDGKSLAWAVPVLFLRGPDGKLFEERPRRPALPWLLAVLIAVLFLAVLSPRLLQPPEEEAVDHGGAQTINALGGRFAAGNPEFARKAFRRALDLDPDLVEAYSNLADLAIQDGNEQEAIRLYQEAVLRQPETAELHYNLGWLLARRGDFDEAQESLRRAIALDRQPEAYNELARLLLDHEFLDEADQEIQKGLKIAPQYAPLLAKRGWLALERGKPDEAIEDLRAAVKLPSNAQEREEALSLLVRAYTTAGRSKEACEAAAQLNRPDAQHDVSCPPARSLSGAEVRRRRSPAVDPEAPLRAVVIGSGPGVGVGDGASVEARSRLARNLSVVHAGEVVKVAEGSFADLVCSTEHRIRLKGGERWTLRRQACLEGEPLRAGAFAWIAPEAGRLHVTKRGALMLLRPTRGPEQGDPAVPTVLGPRNTGVLQARPEIFWTGVSEASDYQIEVTGLSGKSALLDASQVSCGPSSRFPGSPVVCSTSFPPGYPDLEAGIVVFVKVSARRGIASPFHPSEGSGGFCLLPDEKAAAVKRTIEEIRSLSLDERVRKLLEAGVYVENGLFAEAIPIYQGLADLGSGEIRVTLGDLYLSLGLYRSAAASYRAAGESNVNPSIRAAAELGLGRVDYAVSSFDSAFTHFRRARELYRGAGLREEVAAVEKLTSKAREMLRGTSSTKEKGTVSLWMCGDR